VALVSVEAVYEDGQIRLLESPPVHGAYRVLITFVEPVTKEEEEGRRARRLAQFQRSIGSWRDDRPVEEMLRDIHDARRSKPDPPKL
jgi:hypothetical protein